MQTTLESHQPRAPLTTVQTLLAGLLLALALVGLPLAGAWQAGLPMAQLREFPPHSRYIQHAPFSWAVFAGLAALLAAVLLPLVLRVWRAQRRPHAAATAPANAPCGVRCGRFPWWGWCGLALGVVAWVLAWTRFPWFEPLQRFTFSPLWIAYILVVNALTFRRRGHCLLTDQPWRLLLLAAVSALFWWYFEYLNRFVQNWVYAGVGELSARDYALFATLPFATVLPAVCATEELLATCPRVTAGLATFRPMRLTPAVGWGLGGAAALALFLLPFRPNALFPLLWLAPALLLAGGALLRRRPCVLNDLARGDATRLARLALAALVCGFFWEMWNYYSLARWEYLVPYVNRFHLFEMPILGYAGYLPFGIECALVADTLLGRHPLTHP